MKAVEMFGYIDPVSGSVLLQLIVAGAVGWLAFFFKPVSRLFRRNHRSETPPDLETTGKRSVSDKRNSSP